MRPFARILLAAAMVIGATALAGDPVADVHREFYLGQANHRALGRPFISIHPPAAASEAAQRQQCDAACSVLISGNRAVSSVIEDAIIARDGPAEERPVMRFFGADGKLRVETPLPKRAEDLVTALRSIDLGRVRPAPGPTFRQPFAPEYEFSPPPGWTLYDVISIWAPGCFIRGTNDRLGGVAATTWAGNLADIPERVVPNAIVLFGRDPTIIAKPDPGATEGTFKVKFIESGSPAHATFEVAGKTLFIALATGEGVEQKDADLLLEHLKKGVKK